MTEQKELTPEVKEMQRKLAIANLDSSLWGYALPSLVNAQKYGSEVSETAKAVQSNTLATAPDQSVYEQLFAPMLMDEAGSLNSAYLQKTSSQVLHNAFFQVKVDDLVKYTGLKGDLKESYQDKYVSDLSEEDRSKVVGTVKEMAINSKVQDLQEMKRMTYANGLEKMLFEEKKEE